MGLTEIPGIGPATERKLQEAGIGSVEQLANTEPEATVPGVPQATLEKLVRNAQELTRLTPYAEAPGYDHDDHGNGGVASANGDYGDAHAAAAEPGFLQRLWERLKGER